MREKLLALLVIIICTASFLPDKSGATSCVSCMQIGQGPPCQEFWRADAVFTGIVTEASAVDWSGTNIAAYSQYQRLTARLSVEQSFRGMESAEVVFEMNDCPYPFKHGERYLVYAHKDREGKLYQRIGFSRTRPLSEAGEDLEYIRGISSAQPGSKIYGRVTRTTNNIKESRYDYEPLTGVKVILDGNEQKAEAVTDGDGQYQFGGLPAGAYSVRAELPQHLNVKEQTIKVTGQGCVPVDVFARSDGKIRGRVLNVEGQPVASISVSLVSADAIPEEILSDIKDRNAWTFSVTNNEGRFEFWHLAPGGYLLIINRAEYEKTRGNEKAQTLPRLFYPGVAAMEHAEVITVREGGKTGEYEFRLLTR